MEGKPFLLFGAIGQMVNVLAGGDDETVSSSRYRGRKTGGGMAQSNVDEAARRAKDMNAAMAWLSRDGGTIPEDEEEGEETTPSPGEGLFNADDDFWEGTKGGSTVGDTPDVMTMIQIKQDESTDKKKILQDDRSLASRGAGAPISGLAEKTQAKAKEARRASRMKSTLLWRNEADGNSNNVEDIYISELELPVDLTEVLNWWETRTLPSRASCPSRS